MIVDKNRRATVECEMAGRSEHESRIAFVGG